MKLDPGQLGSSRSFSSLGSRLSARAMRSASSCFTAIECLLDFISAETAGSSLRCVSSLSCSLSAMRRISRAMSCAPTTSASIAAAARASPRAAATAMRMSLKPCAPSSSVTEARLVPRWRRLTRGCCSTVTSSSSCAGRTACSPSDGAGGASQCGAARLSQFHSSRRARSAILRRVHWLVAVTPSFVLSSSSCTSTAACSFSIRANLAALCSAPTAPSAAPSSPSAAASAAARARTAVGRLVASCPSVSSMRPVMFFDSAARQCSSFIPTIPCSQPATRLSSHDSTPAFLANSSPTRSARTAAAASAPGCPALASLVALRRSTVPTCACDGKRCAG
mmetsp:Transcript_38333/g.94929  ORF Transcript_38333/g.94929 Transcript_38333/m.94929 type:complete len:337 (-) Transcript_38333:385-1395(-)